VSFDEPDWDDVDPEDDEDDDPVEDWDDNWHWYDDPPRPAKEEPDCYACNDAGCRSCIPSRLDILRWRLRSRIRDLLNKLRRRPTGIGPDEPPF
jgi:hypothetical protein